MSFLNLYFSIFHFDWYGKDIELVRLFLCMSVTISGQVESQDTTASVYAEEDLYEDDPYFGRTQRNRLKFYALAFKIYSI